MYYTRRSVNYYSMHVCCQGLKQPACIAALHSMTHLKTQVAKLLHQRLFQQFPYDRLFVEQTPELAGSDL